MVNTRKRSKMIVGTIAAVVVVAGVVMLVRRTPSPSVPSESQQPGGTVKVSQPVVSHAEKGALAWQLQLREMNISAGGRTVAAQGLREGLIYDSEGKPIVRVTADRISGDTTTRNFSVTGNVTVTTPKGVVFSTDTVKWIQDEGKLECPGLVTMRSKQMTVTTTGLEFYVNQDLVKCPNFIKMVNGENTLVGRNLRYNIKTASFELESVQALFNAEQVRALAQEARR